MGGAAAAGTAGSAAAAYVTNKFVQEPEFRAWLRGDYAYAAKVVEETLLPEYAPEKWSQQVRIEDDHAFGDNPNAAVGIPTPTPVPSVRNPGASPHIPQAWSEVGQGFFKKFKDGPNADPTTAALDKALEGSSVSSSSSSTPSTSTASSPVAPVASAVASAVNSPSALVTGKGAASAPDLQLAPIAPDDEELPSAASLISPGATPTMGDEVAFGLEEHGGPDGARWGMEDETAIITAWSSSKPPYAANRLLVPEASAREYEASLAAHAKLCPDGEAPQGYIAAASRPQQGSGRCYIALPEYLRDGAFDDVQDGKARLAWLRAREAYVNAEVAAIDANIKTVARRAIMSEGGGTALRRMRERKRVLGWQMKDLEEAKKEEKRLLSGKGIALSPWPASAPLSPAATSMPTPQEPAVEEDAWFIAATKFEGAKAGYVFKKDAQGLGYYLDDAQKKDEMAAAAILKMAGRGATENKDRNDALRGR